jgi:short-subunit dehydrogenase involved in D-alanine esterification of teichoic acids
MKYMFCGFINHVLRALSNWVNKKYEQLNVYIVFSGILRDLYFEIQGICVQMFQGFVDITVKGKRREDFQGFSKV